MTYGVGNALLGALGAVRGHFPYAPHPASKDAPLTAALAQPPKAPTKMAHGVGVWMLLLSSQSIDCSPAPKIDRAPSTTRVGVPIYESSMTMTH